MMQSYQPHKMVKHTQTIRRQKLTNCLSVYDHFVRLALKWISSLCLKDCHWYTDTFLESHRNVPLQVNSAIFICRKL